MADWRAGLLLLSAIVAGGATLHAVVDTRSFDNLVFDGQRWSLTGRRAVKAAKLEVALDFQSLLLVCLTDARNTACWLWLDRSARSEIWQDLRRAVYSRAQAADQASEPSEPRRAATLGAHPFSP